MSDNMQTHDLRDLLMLIKNNKADLRANYSLEFDCKITTTDVKPLIKAFNYCFNFLMALSENNIETSLNASHEYYLLNMIASTDKTEFPEVNPQVIEVLSQYNGTLQFEAEPGKWVKLEIRFE